MTDQEHERKHYLDISIKEQPTYENCAEDILYLLDTVKEMIESDNGEITEDDIVNVFYKLNIKRIQESGLTELKIYKNGRKPKLGKPKELAGYILVNLAFFLLGHLGA
ncbi:hypothetical protein C1645_819367 [Glomus cerebriforme]|uniref:Uncharacterized protein n=1 Tax=Glomus cerebriforme TaxID=658196 RepID=A0A397T5E9_9GLOM|nr:hypothetical protein C1645_819367 [Glomus cerebriforme]